MGWKFELKPDGERWLAAIPAAAETTWVSDGEDDRNTVLFYAGSVIPQTLISNGTTLWIQSYDARRIGYKHYEVVASYGPQPLNDWSWAGTTAGERVRVRVGRHIQSYGVTVGVDDDGGGFDPPNQHGEASSLSGSEANLYEGLINYKKETGEAEGIDIVIGGLISFDYIQPVAAGVGTMAYMRWQSDLVGMLNRFTCFGTWAQGELLYLGADYQDGRYVSSKIVHHFAAAKNLTDQIVEGITGVTKKGWDVAWVEYQRVTKNNFAAGKPVRIHVEQVYEYTSEFHTRLGVPS